MLSYILDDDEYDLYNRQDIVEARTLLDHTLTSDP